MTTNARDEKWSSWIDWSGGECPVSLHESVCWRDMEGRESGPITAYYLDWSNSGLGEPIDAYRYRIKENKSMHSDLKWLAENVSEWRHERLTFIRRKKGFPRGCAWASEETENGNYFTRPQWQAARQQLGLDQPEVTEAEEEAWQAKERQLIGSPRTAERFLHQAAELMAERGKQYDQPGGERSMGKAVAALNAITGRDLTEAEGWLLMSLVKRVRQHSGAGYHQDSAEDAVAYAALEAEALESAK